MGNTKRFTVEGRNFLRKPSKGRAQSPSVFISATGSDRYYISFWDTTLSPADLKKQVSLNNFSAPPESVGLTIIVNENTEEWSWGS
jgi:hypothetical protein